MKRYNPTEIEPKWQQIWRDDQRYKAPDFSDKPKYYVTGMFPYPSGAGMHVGHFMEHSIVDAVARFRRANGHNVVYPMGWDAFGLPAENYAIKTGQSPQVTTETNIASFKNQLTRVGASIDWSREVNTSSPEYYKWTQWIFTQLFERGLAYQKQANQWWCPVDMTVLANEQVEAGKCWRCGSEVEKKSMKQWFFKITDYADALLDEIPALDWPDKIKTAQTNWIGRSEGAEIDFAVEPANSKVHDTTLTKPTITVFTTRPDTIFGATFMVVAPEHPVVRQLVTDETRETVGEYVSEAIKKSEIERSSEGKEKTGVFSGGYALNPATGEKIPIWVADYVLWGYGTGAIMAVPAHDERDFAFATKFGLPVTQVIFPCEADSANPPKEGLEMVERPTVVVHLRDVSTDKYAVLDWHGTLEGVRTAIMGGIEDGQTPAEAALIEISEEAGLKNAAITKIAPWMTGAEYCASHKNQNRRAIAWVVEAEVENLDQQMPTAEYEQKTHTLAWIDKSDVHEYVTPSHQKQLWRILQNDELVTGEGTLIHSGQFDGMSTSEAREQIVAWLEQQGVGRPKVTYKMRDWLVSRQRYWGAPIPIVHCETDGAVAVPTDQLPVLLPEVADYEPKGQSVLASQTEWLQTTCPKCGGAATRETDTMDGYACSSWYLLRYTDPHNNEQAWAPEKANYWTPLDMYVGGDHAVAHLLYVRFWNHVFYDMKLVPTREPVKKLVYHGLIQAEDGRKMSKSLGNVVDPLEVIDQGYGADALRTFELFLGPINENSSWNSRGIAGVYRFLNRVWTLAQEFIDANELPEGDHAELAALRHRTVKKVTTDIHRLSFNTAIAALMEYVNELYKLKTAGYSTAWREPIETLVQLVAPFAPHMAAELWQQLGRGDQLDTANWPTWDDDLTVAETMTIVVQVNGKLRAKLDVPKDASEADITAQALAHENIVKHLENKQPTKIVYIPGRLVSIVV